MPPLATKQSIPALLQLPVLLRRRQNLLDYFIRRVTLLAGVQHVLRATRIDPVDNLAANGRMEDHLEEGRLVDLVKLVIDSLGMDTELSPLLQNRVGLVVVDDRVCLWLNKLELASAGVHGVLDHDIGDLFGMLGAELAGGPGLGPLLGAVNAPSLHVVAEVEPVVDGDLVRLHVADVDDPDSVSAAGIGHVHLLGRLGKLHGVDPLVVTWVTDVVEVVVNTSASSTRGLVEQRKTADMAPVVIGPQQGDVIGNLEAGEEVGHDLLVQTPRLGNGGDVGYTKTLGQDITLVMDQSGQHIDNVVNTKALDSRVTGTAHAHGPQAVARIRLGSLDTIAEVVVDGLVVEIVRPRALVEVAELVLCTHHGLGVGGTEDNLEGVGERLVARVIDLEHGSPKCGPEVVGTQTEKNLEDEAVEGRSVAGTIRRSLPVLLDPVGQGWLLIVEEDTSVLDRWGTLDLLLVEGIDVLVLQGRHVRPEIPWANTNLLAHIVDAENGSARVGSGNDQC